MTTLVMSVSMVTTVTMFLWLPWLPVLQRLLVFPWLLLCKRTGSPTLYFPSDAHNVKKCRVIKTF